MYQFLYNIEDIETCKQLACDAILKRAANPYMNVPVMYVTGITAVVPLWYVEADQMLLLIDRLKTLGLVTRRW